MSMFKGCRKRTRIMIKMNSNDFIHFWEELSNAVRNMSE